MSEQARELAELMGWKCPVDTRGDSQPTHLWMKPDGGWGHLPAYDTDLNAMREVWAVLKERGLWGRFQSTYINDVTEFLDDEFLYSFLNDLPGQVTAAIKVFEEAQA